MGTTKDMSNRVDLRREDDQEVQQRIQRARDRIYKEGILPGSTALDGNDLLIGGLTSTQVSSDYLYNLMHSRGFQSAFSKALTSVNDNVYDLLAVDLLHEFELGVWKAVLVHLLRIIDSLGRSVEAVVNARYVISTCST